MFVAACALVSLSCVACVLLCHAPLFFFFFVVLFILIKTFDVNSWDGFSRYTFSQPLVDKKSFTYIGSGRNGLKTVR